MPSLQNLKEIFGDPPFINTIFSFDPHFKAIFFMPPSNPTSSPTYLMKNEGSLSETKKRHTTFLVLNKFNNIFCQ